MNDSSRGGKFEREVQAMGDAEQLKNPKSESPNSTPEQREDRERGPTEEAGEEPAATSSESQSKPSVRRSSIRPAPADYRPSVRDPSTMRPMMVVRAGDAEPAPARLGISREQTEKPPPTLSDDPIASEASSSLSATSERDAVSLAIPLAPRVPTGLGPGAKVRQPASEVTATSADSAEVRPRFGAEGVALDPDSSSQGVPHEAAATSERRAGVSTHVPGSVTSNHTIPRVIVLTLAVIALVSVVVGLRGRVTGVKTHAAQQPSPVEPVPQPSPVIAQAEPSPAIQEIHAPGAADEKGAPERGAPEPIAVEGASAPAASAVQSTTHVALSLKPIDARVYIRGREVPGPPYEFDIAKGEHLAVEVVRFGFVTAKVVLDDKKPFVTFGMLRERWKKSTN